MYANSNRSKLTRSSLKTLSKKFGENQMKSIRNDRSARGQLPANRSPLSSLLTRGQRVQDVGGLPVTARQLSKLDRPGIQAPGLAGEESYASPSGKGRRLQSHRSATNLAARKSSLRALRPLPQGNQIQLIDPYQLHPFNQQEASQEHDEVEADTRSVEPDKAAKDFNVYNDYTEGSMAIDDQDGQ